MTKLTALLFARKQLTNKAVIILFLALGLVFFMLSLGRPIPSDDVLLYSLIGRAIYEKGLLPFSFIFDHKPIFTYYIYGLAAVALPDNIPKFQLLSVLGYALTALVTRMYSKTESWAIHFIVILGLSIRFLRFTANTQLIFSALALISVILVVRGRGYLGIFMAGAIAAIAFNINYLAAFSIGPAVIYILLTYDENKKRDLFRIIIYSLGFILAFAAALLPLMLDNAPLTREYFAAEHKFLSGYKTEIGFQSLAGFLASSAPLLFLFVFCVKCHTDDKRLRNCLVIMVVFAFIGALSPGKFYWYYLYALVPPLTCLYSISTNRQKRLALVFSTTALAALSVRTYIDQLGPIRLIPAAYDNSQFAKIKSIVGDQKILSIRSHPALLYYAGVSPMQNLVWIDHAEIIYGPKEDDYFLSYLDQRPKFVALGTDVCAESKPRQPVPLTCKAIRRNYSLIMTTDDREEWRRSYLYKINGY